MNVVKNVSTRGGEMGDLLSYLWKNKLWFLIPFIVILLIFGALIIFASATGVAPFIYTII
ncbi:MAG TPA: DUF5989 family protein [Patescibacteria group bacterium]|nr:DUF5989 family protein [Patescibacteria group bacterium]